MQRTSLRFVFAVAALAATALVLSPAVRAAFDEEHSFSGGTLEVRNMIGKIDVHGHSGSEYVVRVHVRGKDASQDLIQVRTEQGAKPSLSVVFPVDRERDYVYPELDPGSRTTFALEKEGGSWLSSLLGSISGKNVTVRGRGKGLEVWADLEVLVPAGADLDVRHHVGDIEAADLEANLNVDASSGRVGIAGVRGDVMADTGSGAVDVRDVHGRVTVDTGSGHVSVASCEGDRVYVDTGSGHVELRDVGTRELTVDTGSGGVTARGVGADAASIDTGSGSVELELTRMGDGDFVIDTGSGGVTLALPADASASVHAETGSGGITMDLDGVSDVRTDDDDEIRFRIGAGEARVKIDTGSGGVRFVRAG